MVEINNESGGTYNTNNQIKFKTSILKSSLRDYSDTYILVSGTVIFTEVGAGGENSSIQVVFKNCTSKIMQK